MIHFTPEPTAGIHSDAAAALAQLGIPALAPVVYAMEPDARRAIDEHVRSSSAEVAGILVGEAWVDDNQTLVLIRRAAPATDHVETSSVHVTFLPGAWESLSTEIEAEGESAIVVGWYHSHPGLTAFFSGTDRHTQASYFREPWQVGIVIDPRANQVAMFSGPLCIPVLQEAVLALPPVVMAEVVIPMPNTTSDLVGPVVGTQPEPTPGTPSTSMPSRGRTCPQPTTMALAAAMAAIIVVVVGTAACVILRHR